MTNHAMHTVLRSTQLRRAENRIPDRGISMGELRVASPHPHPPLSLSAGSRPSLMGSRQGCATVSVLFCGIYSWAGDRLCRGQSQGTSKCGSHRWLCVLSESGERGRKGEGED